MSVFTAFPVYLPERFLNETNNPMSATFTKDAVFIGIHLAKDGVNVGAITETGETLASLFAPFAAKPTEDKGRVEMLPEIWWDATRLALGRTMSQIRTQVASPSQLKAISVCGQPGVLVILGRDGRPAMPAILAEDARAGDAVVSLSYQGLEHSKKMGSPFKATDAIAKICWIKENLPEMYENVVFAHQTDYILGMLKGEPDATEFSIAMNTGCDLIDECWPDWLDYDMHLGVRDRLPQLVALGTPIGKVTHKASSMTGLPVGMKVVMGTATATASFLAAGAKRPGDFYTEINDSLSFRGMSNHMIQYPNGLIRMFKLPGRVWFFSTEANTGAEWIRVWFDESFQQELLAQAEPILPTDYLAYPNVRKGETFPFCSTSAEGFISPATDNRIVQFASCIQGMALFERLCYQKLVKLAGLDSLGDIYSGGRWCKDDAWMQCRADVTGRINHRMASANGAAFGAAMMAAIGSHFPSVEQAAEAMIHEEKVFFPNPKRIPIYADRYAAFEDLMDDQGFV
ncbi:MAG TPA: hypothetical protein DEB39_01750 [Planctomycetaceae bacterium]|nr:hypothetical protein [Planctomycetaceae bacterium]